MSVPEYGVYTDMAACATPALPLPPTMSRRAAETSCGQHGLMSKTDKTLHLQGRTMSKSDFVAVVIQMRLMPNREQFHAT